MLIMPPVFNAGDTIYFFFNSYAGSTGASATITGLLVGDIEVYKNGSVTQRASDNGYALLDTDGIDFDGSVGLNGFSIDTSDNSDSGFWADGAQYLVHVDAITVDSQTVRFSYLLTLGYLLRPTTAGRKLDVSSGGEAGMDWANVGSPTTTLNLSGTTIKTATDVETDTADIQSRIGTVIDLGSGTTLARNLVDTYTVVDAGYTVISNVETRVGVPSNLGSGASVAANLVDIESQTDDIGAAGAGLTALATQASVNTIAGYLDTEIAAILEDTGTTIPAQITALNNLSAAQVNAEVDTALADYDPPTRTEATADKDAILSKLLKYVQLMFRKDSAIATDNATELTAINANGGSGAGSASNTTDSLEAIRDRGDAAWTTGGGGGGGDGDIGTNIIEADVIEHEPLDAEVIESA